MIEIRNLEKSFGEEQVLKKINLDIKDGDIFGLIGRSGVGKTTLLRCINGLENYDAGSLKVNGKEVGELEGLELREFRRQTGMIFQHFSLTERDTVYQNIALPMKCWKYDKKIIDARIEELLKIVDLEEKRNQKSRNLSGGQKQRVAIARALAMEPSILLCDEATSSLDPRTTQSILSLLKEINEKLGVTIVIVTHEISVVRAICNKMAVLDKNGIADAGDVERVFMNRCPALLDLLGDEQREYDLPTEGINLRFMYSSNTMDKNVFSKMVQETGITFDLLNANTDQYRTGVLGEFVINVSEEDEKIITTYLSDNNITWEKL